MKKDTYVSGEGALCVTFPKQARQHCQRCSPATVRLGDSSLMRGIDLGVGETGDGEDVVSTCATGGGGLEDTWAAVEIALSTKGLT